MPPPTQRPPVLPLLLTLAACHASPTTPSDRPTALIATTGGTSAHVQAGGRLTAAVGGVMRFVVDGTIATNGAPGGAFKLTFTAPPSGVSGRVTCVAASGNRAKLYGLVESASAGAPLPAGSLLVADLFDGGTGATAPPDRVGFRAHTPGTSLPPCASYPDFATGG